MTERIQLGPVRGNFLARRAFQTFADDHDAIFQRGNGFFDLGEEFVLQEGNFRYQDEVRRVNGTALRQHGAGAVHPHKDVQNLVEILVLHGEVIDDRNRGQPLPELSEDVERTFVSCLRHRHLLRNQFLLLRPILVHFCHAFALKEVFHQTPANLRRDLFCLLGR